MTASVGGVDGVAGAVWAGWAECADGRNATAKVRSSSRGSEMLGVHGFVSRRRLAGFAAAPSAMPMVLEGVLNDVPSTLMPLVVKVKLVCPGGTETENS